MITVADKKKCCGCWACAQVCPKHCISMEEDDEGFRYPSVDTDVCIDCHLCEKACPMLANIPSPSEPLKCFAVVNQDDEIRLRSSSGGVFYPLAKNVITAGGVVCGAVFDEKGEVYHTVGSSIPDIEKMMGSKYMQSRIEQSYIQVKEALARGVQVLFVGTPCQVAGLNGYLQHKEYDNLLTVDLLCHGAPSPLVWQRYVHEKFGGSGVLSSVNFRDKTPGWGAYALKVTDGKRILAERHPDSEYFKAFFTHLSLRQSCSSCWFKKGRCRSDITLGDFWGVNVTHPNWNDNKGISVVLANTQKGLDALLTAGENLTIREISKNDALTSNLGHVEDIPAHPKRSHFFALLSRGKTVTFATRQCTKRSLLHRVASKVKRILKSIAKSILPDSAINTLKSILKK